MMKYALVTGATSGIGAEYAHQLAEAGHNIIVVSNRDGENGIMAERLRRECGVQAEPLYADLAQADAAEKIYAWCRARQAEVDILVSNAGILHFGLLTRTDTAAIDRIVTLHCTTPAKLCRLFAADMCRRGEGRILLMSSITAWTPYPTMSLYGSTKAFLYDLTPQRRRLLRRLGLMMSAREVARRALRAMMHSRKSCTPGLAAKIETLLCRLLPARAVMPLMRLSAVRRMLER